MRAHDWSTSPIGDPSTWPQSLRSVVQLMLDNRQLMFVAWGPELTFLYNDGYAPTFGKRHPWGLGRPFREVWSDIWDVIEPLVNKALAGEATYDENLHLVMERNGYPEDAWFTFSYSPLRDESGRIAGMFCAGIETTGQVLADRRLTDERERQRRMLQQMPGFAALLSGPEHRYEYVNDAYREAAGERDFIGRTVREVFPDITGQGFFELLDQVYATGEPFAARAMPISLDREDGQRFIDLLFEPIRSDNAEVTGIFVGGYDVTERRQTEERLVESEARLSGIFAQATVGLSEISLDGRFVRANDEMCRMLGRSCDDILASGVPDVTHREDVEASVRNFHRVVETGERVSFDNRYSRPDGSVVFAHSSLSRLDDEQGRPRGVLAVTVDLSARRRAEGALRTSEARYQTLFESIESGFCVAEVRFDAPDDRADYRIVEANPAFYRHTGFPEGILGQWLRTAAPTLEEHWYETYGRVARTGEAERFEQGSAMLGRWFDVFAFRVGGADERRVAILFNDISARRNAEEQLRELNETLETRVTQRTAELEAAQAQLRQSQKMEAMGSLTGGVAHDFNNLLTPIVGALDMLQRRGLGGDREKRLIDGAAQSAERARTLVQRLLAFARRQPLQPVAVDVARLVKGMADLVASTTGPQIKVAVDAADDLPPAKADPNQLEMALLNLAVNARDAMPDGGTLRVSTSEATVRAGADAKLRPGRYIRVSVADTGLGMDEATLARAVEPFFSTKGIGKGTGLGLSMVHGLALQLGGALTITSKPGLGTNVELWLPQTDEAPETPAVAHDVEAMRGRGTALLVDDEESVRLSTADMLVDLGYRVVEAGCAEEALRAIAGGAQFDLVVTDHLMPGMTGTDLARTVRARSPDLPVLVVSGYAEVEGIAPDLPRLTKPFRKDELAASLAGLASFGTL